MFSSCLFFFFCLSSFLFSVCVVGGTTFLFAFWSFFGPRGSASVAPMPMGWGSSWSVWGEVRSRPQNVGRFAPPKKKERPSPSAGLASRCAQGRPPCKINSLIGFRALASLKNFFQEAESDPKCIAQALLAVKRDIVDTYCHASGAFCHNRTKQSPIPISWRESKAERQRTAKQSS